MRVGLMTREYPPKVYGGAGVHVEYLSRELAKLIEVEVHCWGTQHADAGNLHVRGEEPPAEVTAGLIGEVQDGGGCAGAEPGADEGAGGDRHCAYAYVVCVDGGLSGEEAVQHSVCADHPSAGAAARVEGGATGLGLCDELVDGADGDPGRGCDRRGVAWDQGGYSEGVSGGGCGEGACDLQRHRPEAVSDTRLRRTRW